jgi:FtsP/CotA-like multicopper oxidase with cupredoxin domain
MYRKFLNASVLILAAAGALVAQPNPCPHFAPGSTISEPPSLFSQNGKLSVQLTYNFGQADDGNPRFCFATPDGLQSPTLNVSPGDTLTIVVKNNLPQPTSADAMTMSMNASTRCGAAMMNTSSVNLHYHGTNTSPSCHSDEVIHTLINSGETFTYHVSFPLDEPPGLYWYHPHVHGMSEPAVQGGASGAIVVQGIENVQPAVAGLPQRVFVIRDQLMPQGPFEDSLPGGPNPEWDLSVNYVPILYPSYTPGRIEMKPGQKEFWRISNSCANTILDLQLIYDGIPQVIQIVALDGVPTGSQDGTADGTLVPVTDILVPPAGRVEFIVIGPASSVQNALLQTLWVNTGPAGDNVTKRPLFSISPNPNSQDAKSRVPVVNAFAGPKRFAGLVTEQATTSRKLYFSENVYTREFYITVEGQQPTLFSPDHPPAIITRQGAVEDWTIENRTNENHEFHMHQTHFLLLERNGVPVPPEQQQMLDVVDIPFNPNHDPTVYPSSVTVRMDFRGPTVGDFVYHCHILDHEDNGMMAVIRVLPRLQRHAPVREPSDRVVGNSERQENALPRNHSRKR